MYQKSLQQQQGGNCLWLHPLMGATVDIRVAFFLALALHMTEIMLSMHAVSYLRCILHGSFKVSWPLLTHRSLLGWEGCSDSVTKMLCFLKLHLNCCLLICFCSTICNLNPVNDFNMKGGPPLPPGAGSGCVNSLSAEMTRHLASCLISWPRCQGDTESLGRLHVASQPVSLSNLTYSFPQNNSRFCIYYIGAYLKEAVIYPLTSCREREAGTPGWEQVPDSGIVGNGPSDLALLNLNYR